MLHHQDGLHIDAFLWHAYHECEGPWFEGTVLGLALLDTHFQAGGLLGGVDGGILQHADDPATANTQCESDQQPSFQQTSLSHLNSFSHLKNNTTPLSTQIKNLVEKTKLWMII